MAAADDTERWLPVVGWEDRYQVSDRGRVWSNERRVISSNGVARTLRPKLLSMSKTKDGYARACLSGPDGTRWCYIHELMLEAFVGQRPDGFVACHKDDDKSNNVITNLRWDNVSENMRDKVRNGHDHNASRTHCVHGHEFTPENTYPQTSGGRGCKTCRKRRSKEWRERHIG